MERMEEILNGKNWNEVIDSMEKGKRNTCIQSIESLLDAGLDVNYVNKYGTTMLSYATECGNLGIVRFLVKKGADANVANFNGTKPLHIAAQYFRKDILKYFLSLGISADSYDRNNCTALHYVVEKSDTSSASRDICQELIHILVDHDADLNSVNRKGFSPMILAAKKSHQHIVELFIRLGADLKSCDPDHWSVLHFACQEGWTGTVQTLLEGRFEVDLNAITSAGRTPAIIAAASSREDIVSLLVESGADVECKGLRIQLIHFVCRRGWLDVVKLLVSKGADIHARDFYGNTPLFSAASKRSVMDYLIECGADVKGCNSYGWTLLHWACHLGWFDMVKFLVSKGCDINAKDSAGFTPSRSAALSKNFRIAVYLIEYGADLKDCDGNGWTILHFACFSGWFHVVKALVSKGADINVKTNLGETPLHHAVCTLAPWQDSRVIEYLIRNGAYFQLEDYNGSMRNLKNGILQNIQLCTLAVINKYNNCDLHKFWEIPQVPEMLLQVCKKVPQNEKLKIASMNGVAKDIAECVEHQIKNKGFCNVFSMKPMVLQQLCVLTLIKHYNVKHY